tara:strand:+ start:6894 stop:7292 length:399 start_codon:yes stop_codon:yes gene_type:complete
MIRMHPSFAEELPALREAWGQPLAVNSVCRCKEHNDRPANQGGAGGNSRSLHVCDKPHHPTQGTMAADIRWRGLPLVKQLKFARLAWSRGWSVGLHNGFCHVDRRIDIGMRQAVFLYGTWSGAFAPQDVING